MDWGTASGLEILWTMIAGVGYGFALRSVATTQRDVRTLPRKLARGNRWGQPFTATEQAQLRQLARTNRRHALERAYMLLVLIVAGGRAMLVPPPLTVDNSIGATVVGVLFLIMGLDLTVGAIRDTQDRTRFDRL